MERLLQKLDCGIDLYISGANDSPLQAPRQRQNDRRLSMKDAIRPVDEVLLSPGGLYEWRTDDVKLPRTELSCHIWPFFSSWIAPRLDSGGNSERYGPIPIPALIVNWEMDEATRENKSSSLEIIASLFSLLAITDGFYENQSVAYN